MNEHKTHMDPEVLIGKFLSHEATDEEVKWLEDWVQSDPANRALFIKTKKAFNLGGVKDGLPIDTDRAWGKISDTVFTGDSDGNIVSITRNPNRIWRIAAAIAVLIVASIWVLVDGGDSGMVQFDTASMVMVDELPDGSTISLNRNSSMSFEQNKERNVTLKGDAYFEVKRDEHKAFVVQADDLKVRVLGTSFYVNAKVDEPNIEVVVNTGSVSVSHQLDSLVLSAGESALFHRENKTLIQSSNDDINYLSWKTRTLIFDDVELAEVISKINEVYDAGIILENQRLGNCKITVTFKQQELESILAIISETLDLTIRNGKAGIVLDGNTCN